MSLSRSRGTVIGVVMMATLVVSTVVQSGSESRAQSGDPSGELQIDDLSLTSPITRSSFSVTSATTTSTGGGAGSGKATFSPVVVTKAVNASSPSLMRAVATGVHIPEAIVRVYRPGTTRPAVTYTLRDVVLSGLKQTGTTEEVSLSYRSIEMTSGGASTCFDLVNYVVC